MKRISHIWIAFGLSLALMLAAVAWLSVTVVRLERAEQDARQQAAVEEDVRLALWRADSALASLIAQESVRPYFVYDAFYPARRARTGTPDHTPPGDMLIPSPLLTQPAPYVRLHFQIAADGTVASPEAPPENLRQVVETRYGLRDRMAQAEAALHELTPRLDYPALAAALPLERAIPAAFPPPPATAAGRPEAAPAEIDAAGRQAVMRQQALRNVAELHARNRALQQFPDNLVNTYRIWPDGVTEGPFRPLWVDGALLLARRVSIGGDEVIQGCWLDWPAIATWLSREIADLFPTARFLPLLDVHDDGAAGRMLAALPARLEPGRPAMAAALAPSPTRWLPVSAWGGVILAAMAVAALLAGVVSLSERRAAFVSAVTHELRTPLTTFRLYSDLLAGGMVQDEGKRRRYLRTLSAEASRLAHLVENVLTFARLERGRAGAQVRSVALQELWRDVRGRLAERAEQTGMQLEMAPLPEEIRTAHVGAAPGAVEQILFNLVDNACKYGGGGESNRIEVAAARANGAVLLRVRDHGPGIPEGERRRLFQPFHKSARDAAKSAPGVGLGLALSRRLARSLGGELELCPPDGRGACFKLVVREVNPQAAADRSRRG